MKMVERWALNDKQFHTHLQVRRRKTKIKELFYAAIIEDL